MLPALELVLASAIWGFAFVAQRKGNESLHPFAFNVIRFALGALVLSPFLLFSATSEGQEGKRQSWQPLLLGLILFTAASLQQIGMLWTSAGNAGFITGLYVVYVPIIGLIRGQRVSKAVLLAVLFAITGLWLINHGSVSGSGFGNLLVLVSAVFWALHVQYIDRLLQHFPSLKLAVIQYAVCAILSLLFWTGGAFTGLIEHPGLAGTLENISKAAIPLLYGGIGSVGIAYTLQLHAQKKVAPAPASIILCLEAVFAMFGGWLILREHVSIYSLSGAGLMLGAMVMSVKPAQKE